MKHPKIFISYSHDSQEHRERVLGLAERLRTDGYEAMIDQYVEGTPPQGWPRWMLNQIEWADYVLLVCSETYYRRFRGHESPSVGKGVDWEGAIITNELYQNKSVSRRFVPVFFDFASVDNIPEPLRAASFHVLNSEDGYTTLIDYLADVAGIEPAELGPPPNRKRKTGTPLRFSKRTRPKPKSTTNCAVPNLAALPAPGGTMSSSHALYIERGADSSAKAAARCNCETIVVKGPRQFGKSSLLTRYVAHCLSNGKKVASIDFRRFGSSIISDYGRFLATLASELARRLKLAPPVVMVDTQPEFVDFLEYTLLPSLQDQVIFVFEVTDQILRQEYSQDFFSMIRMWHDHRADSSLEWHKLGLALATSTEPKLYIQDALRSPFGVGLQLALEPFNVGEVCELNVRYGAPLSDENCEELHHVVGGHPFLTQDAFYHLTNPNRISFIQLRAQAARDNGPFREHLRAMLSNLRGVNGLITSLKQVIEYGTAPRNDDFYRLEGAGLVKRQDNTVVTTNQIYADFFRGVE